MKRVLIISYFFPPSTNMGSHRVLRFVRHLREFGWEPVVLAHDFAGGALLDEQLVRRVPADVEVHRVRGVDLTHLWHAGRRPAAAHGTAPVRAHRLTTFLNRWCMVPDKFFPWIGPATRVARRLRCDVVYSTSDPLSDHLVARRLGRPWVAEFRDLWLGSPYFARAHPTALHRAWHARLERQVVAGATTVVGLSRGITEYFARTYGKPARTIYNCFDPAEYPAPPPPAAGFEVVYAGALYSSRSPAPFLAGFAEFAKTRAAKLVIAGGSSDLDLPAMVARHGLQGRVELLGRVAHAEALRRMQAATALLAIQSPEDSVHVPGKLFEYIGARRPLFVVAPPCETADIVTANGLGVVARPDPADIAAKLAELAARGPAAPAAAERFGVRAATRQLAAVLTEAAVAPPADIR